MLSTRWYNREVGVTRDAGSHMCHAPWTANGGEEQRQSIPSPEASRGRSGWRWDTFAREDAPSRIWIDSDAACGHRAMPCRCEMGRLRGLL